MKGVVIWNRKGEIKMHYLYYKHPKDINIHFVGETIIDAKECEDIKKSLQFVGFLIFRILSKQEKDINPFSISVKNKNNRRIIKLCKNDKVILVMIENIVGEWVVRIDGLKEDIKDFVIEYTVKVLADNKKKA